MSFILVGIVGPEGEASQGGAKWSASGHPSYREQHITTLNGVTLIVIVIRVIKGQWFLKVSNLKFSKV